MVDEAVVVLAEQDEVVDARLAAVAPPGDVVGVAAGVGGVAAGELTGAAGSGDQGAEDGGGDEPLGPPDVERFAVVVGDDEADVGPFHQLAQGGSADGSAADDAGLPPVPFGAGDLGAGEQGGEGGGDDEQRPGLTPPAGDWSRR